MKFILFLENRLWGRTEQLTLNGLDFKRPYLNNTFAVKFANPD